MVDRDTLAASTREIHQHAVDEGLVDQADALDRTLRSLQDRRVNVFVVGRSKVGKSTLINGMLGSALLPTSAVPCTGNIIDVHYGSKTTAVIHRYDGSEHRCSVDDLSSYVDEATNPGNIRQVDVIELATPAAALASGIHLFDTPGTESLHPLHERALYAALGRADCALFVYMAPAILPGRRELELLLRISAISGAIVIVQNELWDLPQDDGASVAADFRCALESAGINVLELVRVRPREPDFPGIAEITRVLQEKVAAHAQRVKQRALARKAHHLGCEINARLSLRTKALLDPIESLELRLDHQRAFVTDLRARAARFRADADRALEDMRAKITAHVDSLPEIVQRGTLHRLLDEKAYVADAPTVEHALNDALDGFFDKLEGIVKRGNEILCMSWRDHLNGVDEELSSATGIRFPTAAAELPVGTRHTVHVDPSSVPRVSAPGVVGLIARFMRASAAPISKVAGTALMHPIAAILAEHALNTTLMWLCDRLEAGSSKPSTEAVREAILVELIRLRDDIHHEVKTVPSTARELAEEWVVLRVDARITLMERDLRELAVMRRLATADADRLHGRLELTLRTLNRAMTDLEGAYQ